MVFLMRRRRERRANGDAGMTLVELLIAMVLLTIVIAAAVQRLPDRLRQNPAAKQRQPGDATAEASDSSAPTTETPATGPPETRRSVPP